jgi:hypothetical protein
VPALPAEASALSISERSTFVISVQLAIGASRNRATKILCWVERMFIEASAKDATRMPFSPGTARERKTESG